MDVRRQSGAEHRAGGRGGQAPSSTALRRALPPEVKITVTRDDSRFIHASIASLEEHLLLGSLLASLVIMAFIRNLRRLVVVAGDPGVDHRHASR